MWLQGTWLHRNWAWFYPLIAIIYLLAEFGFNAALLETVSDITVDLDWLHTIELVGRSVSAVGLSLLVSNFLIGKSSKPRSPWPGIGVSIVAFGAFLFWLDSEQSYIWWVLLIVVCGLIFLLGGYGISRSTKTPRAHLRWLVFAVAIVAAGLTAFFGQKILVEKYFVEPTTWEQRLHAQYMHILKAGLSRNLVKIEAAPFDPERLREPEERTFLALVGFLVQSSSDFVGLVERQQDRVVREVSLMVHQEELPKRYVEYRAEGEKFQEHWRQYDESSGRYAGELEAAKQRATEEYARFLNEARSRYLKYQKGASVIERELESSAKTASKKLDSYLGRRDRCVGEGDHRCVTSLDKKYDEEMRRQVGKTVPWQFWCKERPATTGETVRNAVGLLLSYPLTLGRMITGENVMEDKRVECDLSVPAVRDKIHSLKKEDIVKKLRGYPLGLTEAGFFDHNLTVQAAVAELQEKHGLRMPDGWRLSSAGPFKDAVLMKQKEVLDEKWRGSIERIAGGYVPPGLGYVGFVQHSVIQEGIKRVVGENYVPGMHWEMSEREYHEKVLAPAVEKKINDYIRDLKEKARLFENGASRAEEGKRYMRAVIVPPISLFVSGVFAILNLANLFGIVLGALNRYLSKIKENHGESQAISNEKGATGSVVRRIAMWFMTVLIVLFIPLLVPNKFTESRAYQYFQGQAYVHEPVFTSLATWVVHAQPVVYPVGKQVLEAVRSVGIGRRVEE